MRSARSELPIVLVRRLVALMLVLAAGPVASAYAEVDYPGKETDDAAAALAVKEKTAVPPGGPVIQYIVGGYPAPVQVVPAGDGKGGVEANHQALEHVMERASEWRDSSPSNHPGSFPAK